MEKIILTDCDGCLVNWNSGFEQFMIDQGHPRIPGTDHEYSISRRHSSLTDVTAHNFVKMFNEGPYIATLNPLADSVPFIAKLAEKGFKFIVVTSISSAPDAHKYRTQNLHELFGEEIFLEIVCLEMGISKAAELQRWLGTGYFWIEDHMRQAEAGYEAGLKTVLIDHPYNSHYHTDLFPRVSFSSPWEQIYKMVCKEYNLNAD